MSKAIPYRPINQNSVDRDGLGWENDALRIRSGPRRARDSHCYLLSSCGWGNRRKIHFAGKWITKIFGLAVIVIGLIYATRYFGFKLW